MLFFYYFRAALDHDFSCCWRISMSMSWWCFQSRYVVRGRSWPVLSWSTPPHLLTSNYSIMNSTHNLDWESHDYREPETTVTSKLSSLTMRGCARWIYQFLFSLVFSTHQCWILYSLVLCMLLQLQWWECEMISIFTAFQTTATASWTRHTT